MIELELTLLGGFEGRLGSGADLCVSSKKAKVLLAYLTLARGKPCSRDSLARLLWSDSEEERARNSLRQALTLLRKCLGPHHTVLGSDREAVTLSSARVDADVLRLERFCASPTTDTLERASALYRGELLQGLSTRDPIVDDWLDQERESLRARALLAFHRLLESDRGQDSEKIVTIAQALLRLDPLQEAAHRALMAAYAAVGDGTLALRQYTLCRDLLREQLGVAPQRETRELCESLLYERVHGGGEPDGMVCPTGQEASPPRPSLAILPFREPSGVPEKQQLTDALTEGIITELTRFGELFISARESSFAARDRGLGVDEIGKILGVQYVLGGSVHLFEERLQLFARLADASSGRQLWAERYLRPLEGLLDLQSELIATLVGTVWGIIQRDDSHRARRNRLNLDAYGCLARGKANWLYGHGKESLMHARGLFERAMQLDATYAAAHVAMAQTFFMEYEALWSDEPQSALERGEQFAQRGIELDETDAAVQSCYGWSFLYKGDYETAGLHLASALELNPNDYAHFCNGAWFLVLNGQYQAGIERGLGAYRRNPLAPYMCLTAVGLGQYLLGHYEDAAHTLRKIVEPEIYCRVCLAAALAQSGQRAAASTVSRRVRQDIAAQAQSDAVDWEQYLPRPMPIRWPSDLDHLLTGIEQAGLMC